MRGNKFTLAIHYFLALLFSPFLLSLFCSSILFLDQQFLPRVGFCPHRAGSLGRSSKSW